MSGLVGRFYGSAVGASQKWHYASAPQVESVAPSIVTVTVKLEGLA